MKRLVHFLLIIAIPLFAPAAFAVQTSGTETLENFRGPSLFNTNPNVHLPEVHTGPITLTGGMLLTNASPFGAGTVFGTAGSIVGPNCEVQPICEGCTNAIVIKANEPLRYLSFDLIQANDVWTNQTMLSYSITDIDNPARTGKFIIVPSVMGLHVSVASSWDGVIRGVVIKNIDPVDTNANCDVGGGTLYYFAVDNIVWELPPARRLVTGTGPDPADDATWGSASTGAIRDDGTIDVTYPLGMPFYFQVEEQESNNSWTKVDAAYSIEPGDYVPIPERLNGGVYPYVRLFAFDESSTSSFKAFQSVHTGDVTVHVSPPHARPFVAHVHIVKPVALGAQPGGSDSNAFPATFDRKIIALADEAGIPPQYLKAQVAAETGAKIGGRTHFFEGNLWRYLPISIDYRELHQLGGPYNYLSTTPYKNYLLKEGLDGVEGGELCPEHAVTLGQQPHDCAFDAPVDDIQPRYDNGLRVRVGDDDAHDLSPADDQYQPRTIREIFNATSFDPPDDPSQDPSGGFGTVATSTSTGAPISGRPRLVPHPPNPTDRLSVTAQTPLASKYGLLQVSPLEAIAKSEWRGVAPQGSYEHRFNPSLLFDTDDGTGLDDATGSLVPGINRDVINYADRSSEPHFRTRAQYEDNLRYTFLLYHGVETSFDYPNKIVDEYAKVCLPKSPGPVFKTSTNESCTPAVAYLTDDSIITPGGSVTLSVTPQPGSNVTHYQWYEGATGNTSSPVADGQGGSITVSPAASTAYWVAISNACGATNSNVIHVTVAAACPVVTIQSPPASVSISSGQSATLHVTATGATSYQWFIGEGAAVPGMAGNRSNPIPDSNTPDLTVQPGSTTRYWVLVSNGCAETASPSATVAVDCTLPSIETQPQGSSISPGQAATLSIVVNESATPTINWYSTAGVPAGSGPTITVSPDATTAYFARISNSCGAVDSNPALVMLPCVPPSISAQPAPSTITYGGHATLSVTAGGAQPVSVVWRAADGSVVGNAATISVTPAITTTYSAHLSNACGAVDTDSVTVTVTGAPSCAAPAISTQPVDATVAYGQPATLTVSTSVSDLLYQWYQGSSGNTSVPIAGATSAVYVANPLATTSYWVRVSAPCGSSTNSRTVVVNVCVPTSEIDVTGNRSIPIGQSTTLTATATGTHVVYQWYVGQLGDTRMPVLPAARTITVSPQDTTYYWVQATGGCGSTTAALVNVTVCALPTIDLQPSDVTIRPGSTATLTAWASDVTNTPLTYQWYQGESGDLTTLVGNAANFTTPILSADTHYWVRIWCDACGPVDSRTVTVSMCQLPEQLAGPADQSIAAGQTAHLVIPPFSPIGDYSYFWYQGAAGDTSHPLGDFGGDWGPYNYIDVTPSSETQYWAVVQAGPYGNCLATTTAATVRVCVPVITQQPSGGMYDLTHPVTLTVGATSAASYQWYIGQKGDISNPIAGAASSSLTVTPVADTSYWCRVTSTCTSVDSDSVLVTRCVPPAITTQPVGASITQGQSAAIGVAATGTNLSYQWYQGASGNTTNPIAGNTSSITVNPLNSADYWVKVTGACGSVNSNAVHVAVCTTPVITTQPLGANVFSGQTATLTVAATENGSESLHYQWYVIGGSPVGTDSPTFTTPPVTGTTQYAVHVLAGGCSVDSNVATVGVCALPQVINTGTAQNVAIGQNLSLTCVVSPSTGNTFVWYYGTVGDVVHSSQVQAGSSNAYSFTASATNGGTYWATVSRSDDGCVSRTNAYTVNVCIPTITTQPAASTMINSGQSATLTVAANTSGLTYQWYVGTTGTTSNPISGATGASVTVNPTVDTNYWVKVTGTCGQSVNSGTATVTICQPAAITMQPAALNNIVRGQNVTLTVAATGTGLSYQWYQGTSGSTASPVFGNTSSVTVSPLYPIDYWVKVTGTCGTVNSNTAHIAVCTTPVINTQPQSTSTFSGTSATLSVSASEATGETLHYQWYKNGSTAVGTDSATFNTGNLTADTTFFVRITAAGGACSIDSNTVTVSMCPLAQTVTGAPNQNSTPGQSIRLQLPTMPGATAYKWYQGASGNTAAPLTSWQSWNYLDVNPTTTTSYWAQVQNGSCVSNTTTTTVNVCIPTITTQPQNVTIPSGSTTLSVVSNLSGSTYQWYVGTSGTTTTPIANATNASVTVSPSTTTSYWCKVTGPCGSANSNTATVTICTAPSVQTLANAASVNRGYSSGLYSNASGTGLTYQWYIGNSGDTSQPISGATNSSYVIASAQNSEKYWVKVTGTCGSVNSTTAWISVNPVITLQPQQTITLTSGSRASLSVMASGTYLHYQWLYENGQAVSGAPDSPSFVSSDITAATGFYCHVTSANGATDTYHSSVTLCTNDINQGGPVILNQGGNCRQIWANVGGTIDHIEWYQGTKGNTSIPIGNGNYVNVCPSSTTNYWFRVYGGDGACYTDSATITAP